MDEEYEAISLIQMLQAREERVMIQNRIQREHKSILISFTMNIPGAFKNSYIIWKSFLYGVKDMKDFMKKYRLQEIEVRNLSSGPEGYYILSDKCSGLEIKEALVCFEEFHPIGRWFDIDIKDINRAPISRNQIGRESRKCFLCNEDAKVCARSRRHSVQELLDFTKQSLVEYVMQKQGERTA